MPSAAGGTKAACLTGSTNSLRKEERTRLSGGLKPSSPSRGEHVQICSGGREREMSPWLMNSLYRCPTSSLFLTLRAL